MGLIRKAFYTGVLGTSAFVGWLGATTTIICPLPRNDPVWTSDVYRKYNIHKNPTTQDVCIKRVPLSKVRPELLQKEGDLALEFCRGVWSNWGYAFQRKYLERKYRHDTPDSLWTPQQMRDSTYDVGTSVTDHFEVVEKTPTSITVRCGDSPRNSGPRDADGLFVIYAEVDRQRDEVELGLKSVFYTSAQKVEGLIGPMPVWMEKLHTWYSRIFMVSGARAIMR